MNFYLKNGNKSFNMKLSRVWAGSNLGVVDEQSKPHIGQLICVDSTPCLFYPFHFINNMLKKITTDKT